jgi:putative transposase
MTVSRPRLLQVGDDIRFGGELHSVDAVSSAVVRLVNVVGAVSVVPLAAVLSDPGFALASSAREAAPLPPSGLLDGVPEPVAEQARWWERHIVEILTGLPPEHEPTATPKSKYDPARVSLRQRELAKVAELEATGHEVSFPTVKRLRLAYEKEGLWGLVDQRTARSSRPTGRVDERVVAATRQAIAEEVNRSTGTVTRLRRKVTQILHANHGTDAPSLPSERTFYRLVERLSQGKHTFGSAKTRRSVAEVIPLPVFDARKEAEQWRF